MKSSFVSKKSIVNKSKIAKTKKADLLTEIYPFDDSLFPEEQLLGVLYLVDCHGCTSSQYPENSAKQLLTNYFPKLSAHRIKLYSNRGGRH